MFLTGTTNIQAGNGVVFTLDYNALALTAGVVDSYFSEKAVYRKVLCMYEVKTTTATNGQRKTLSFVNGNTTDMMVFSTYAQAGWWELKEVVIEDQDGGSLILSGSQIPNRELYEILITSA